MPTFRGVGGRIKERLRTLGYVRPNGDLRVSDFCMDHRFQGTFFYDWLADRRTPIKDLERLAEKLETSPAWLLFGVSDVVAPSDTPATGNARRTDRAVPPSLPVRRARKVTPKPQRRGVKKIAAISGGSEPPQPPQGTQEKDAMLLIRRWRGTNGVRRAA